MYRAARISVATLTLTMLGACSDGAAVDGSTASHVELVVTALDAAAADTVWDVEIGSTNPALRSWQGRILARAGDGVITLDAPCDASLGESRARIWLVGAYPPGLRTSALGGFAHGRHDGAGTIAATPIPFALPTAPLVHDFTCAAQPPAVVDLDLVLARPATDGFFDHAVTFGEVVCVARLDCCDDFGGDGCAPDGSEDITLLTDATGAPGRTVVLAVACADRAGVTLPTLYLDDVTLDCDPSDGVAGVDVAVHPGAGPTGPACKAGPDGLSSCPAVSEADGVDADAILFQVASFRGVGELQRSNGPLQDAYWNVQLGVRDGISKCHLRARASAGFPWSAGATHGVIDPGVAYPQIFWDAPLAACAAEVARADGPDDAFVRITYASAEPGTPPAFDYTWSPTTGVRAVCAAGCDNGGSCVAPGVCACDGTHFSGPRCAWCGTLGEPCADGFTCTTAGTCSRNDADEVQVPAGHVWMGCDPTTPGCGADEGPRHHVALSPFAIDTFEVTANAYRTCVDAGACDPPAVVGGAYGTFGDPGRGDHPVTFATWDQAATYCAWPDKPAGAQRLCTEAEWERAARGGCDGDAECGSRSRTFPWGEDAPDCKRGNVYALATSGYCHPQSFTAQVGATRLGDSPYGASDLAGNVAEWVADWYGSYVPAWDVDPTGPTLGDERVIRGGSYGALPSAVRGAARDHAPPIAALHDVGFRCCRSLP